MIQRTQTKIAQSRRALPVTAIYAVLICLCSGGLGQGRWALLILPALSTLLMAEFNKVHSLVRIYSQAVPCAFLIMAVMAETLHPSFTTRLVQLALVIFFLCFFGAYQNPKATGRIFYAFVALGIAGMGFVHIFFFLPVVWILLATNVMAFSARTFAASLLGVATPYWVATPYYIYMGDGGFLARHFSALAQLGPLFQPALIDGHALITVGFVFLLAVVGSLHFFAFSYLDKIRTRMIFEALISLDAYCFVLIIALPQYFEPLLGMAAATTAPLIGHYAALSGSKISNICFMAIIALALILTICNLWMPLTIFS